MPRRRSAGALTMRRAFLLPITLLMGGCGTDIVVPADLAITSATVVDVVRGELRPEETVLVESGKIVAVRPTGSMAIPDHAEVVDGTGLFVIPGLWDAHVHSAASVTWHFPLLVAHGVTAVRNMHSTADTALELTSAIKKRISARALTGPRVLANGPIVDGRPPVWPGSVIDGRWLGSRRAGPSPWYAARGEAQRMRLLPGNARTLLK